MFNARWPQEMTTILRKFKRVGTNNHLPRKRPYRALGQDFNQRGATLRRRHHFGKVHVFGFSTVELMVVVGIAITMSAMALPTLFSVLATEQLRGGMNDLSGLFQNAR